MTTAYADVSSAALCYTLLPARPNLAALDPLTRKTLTLRLGGKTVTLELGILGASHYGVLDFPENDGQTLTEVFACGEVNHPGSKLYCGPLGLGGRLGPVSQTVAHGLRYVFRAWTEEWSASCRAHVSSLADAVKAADGTTSIGDEFVFPDPEGGRKSDQLPVTLVHADVSDGESPRIQTVHSYPNESLVVYTETTISSVTQTNR